MPAEGPQKGMPIPRNIRGKGAVDSASPPAALSAPVAREHERVKNQKTRRLTPVSRAFVVQCITSGYNNP